MASRGPLVGRDAELFVGVARDEAVVLGAFQRSSEVGTIAGAPVFRRGSGGGAVRVAPGTIWMQLALARSSALVPCAPDKILNRYVRPLLRALTRVTNVPVHYFGRDWISAAHRPVAAVGFAHEASSGSVLFEAIVGVHASFGGAPRASFMGKAPASLEEVSGRSLESDAVARQIVQAYVALASQANELEELTGIKLDDAGQMGSSSGTVHDEPPWSATRDEAIGVVGAGRDASGRLRVGGELMASRDAIAKLEDALATLAPDATPSEVGMLVDDALAARGAVTFGVRSLLSIRDAILDALRVR